jgi:hypothetical protein
MLLGLLGLLLLAGCRVTTGALPPELEQRFAAEGVVRRADDQLFRYTCYSRSTRGNRWEDRDASIIVTPRSRNRVVISSGSGQSRVSWSFRPPEDAPGWTDAIRAVMAAADSGR